jgi:hypothetical protein
MNILEMIAIAGTGIVSIAGIAFIVWTHILIVRRSRELGSKDHSP